MQYIGSETVVEVGGEKFTLSRYTRRLAHELAEWVSTRIGNPLEDLRGNLDGLPVEVADAAIDHAKELLTQSRSLYSDQFMGVWQSLPGRVFELGLLLRKYHPDADPEDLFYRASLQHGDDYLTRAVIRTIGKMPPDEVDVERRLLAQWGLLPYEVGSEGRQATPATWLEIDKALLKGFHLRPSDLDDMTITEILVLVASLKAESDAIEGEDEKQSVDLADLHRKLEWAKAQKRLTAEQRLRIALEQCGS